MIVGGVGVGKGVFVGGLGVGDLEAVRVARGVRDGPGVLDGIGVFDGVALGGRSGVAVIRASAG
jgi:hypothetical protein